MKEVAVAVFDSGAERKHSVNPLGGVEQGRAQYERALHLARRLAETRKRKFTER